MTIKSSGSLGANEIQAEFGDTGDFVIREYYGAAPGLPTSGTIRWSDFYGKQSPGSPKTYNNQLLFRLSIRHDRIVDIAFDVKHMYGVIWDGTPSFVIVETPANQYGSGSFLNVNYPNGVEPLGNAVDFSLPTVNMTGTSSRAPTSIAQAPNASNGWIAIFRCDDRTPPGAALSSIQGNLTATPLGTTFVGPRPRFDRTFGGPYGENDYTTYEQYLLAPTGSTFISASATFPDPTTGGLQRALRVAYTNVGSDRVTIGVANDVAGSMTYSLGRWDFDLRTKVASNIMACRLRVTGTIRYRGTNYSYTNYLYIHYLEAYLWSSDGGGDGA